MKILHIMSDSENCIEQALIPVSDEASAEERRRALADASRMGVDDPCLEAVYEIAPAEGYRIELAEGRVFVG